jgi:hypothetical protein
VVTVLARFAALGLVVAALGCSVPVQHAAGVAADPVLEEVVAGTRSNALQLAALAGDRLVVLTISPNTAETEFNRFTLLVTERDGRPVPDLGALDVQLDMYDHSMGAPTAYPEGDGRYTASVVRWWMPGEYRVRVLIPQSSGPPQEALFRLLADQQGRYQPARSTGPQRG